MKVLILYGTKHGSTEKCANLLSEKLEGDITVHNVKNGLVNALDTYDKIIIGGSIYAGRTQKGIREFCMKNRELLKTKMTGYFTCGMAEGEEAKQQLLKVFPSDLLENAIVSEHFGGEMILDNMGLFERFIVKKVAKVEKDFSNLSEDIINQFAQQLNKAQK